MKDKDDNYYSPFDTLQKEANASSKLIMNKHDYDLYDEDSNVAHKIYRVKYVPSKTNPHKWRFYEDSKLIYTLEATSIRKKDFEFLRTKEGFEFLLNQAKLGSKHLEDLKNNIKKEVNKKFDKD